MRTDNNSPAYFRHWIHMYQEWIRDFLIVFRNEGFSGPNRKYIRNCSSVKKLENLRQEGSFNWNFSLYLISFTFYMSANFSSSFFTVNLILSWFNLRSNFLNFEDSILWQTGWKWEKWEIKTDYQRNDIEYLIKKKHFIWTLMSSYDKKDFIRYS